MDPVEIIRNGDTALAYLVSGKWFPSETTFVTPDDLPLQMGMIVYGAGKDIVPHLHLPIVREVHGTTECVIVRKGKCAIDFYDDDKQLLTSRTLEQGDIVLLLGGGHGFRMEEDTVLFEVKQGPYAGTADKARF